MIKLTALLVLQTAGTLAAVAVYYAYLGFEIRTYRDLFAALTQDADVLHRKLDDQAMLGSNGRESFGSFAKRIDAVTAALKHGGEVSGTGWFKPIPAELGDSFDEITTRWKLTRTALLNTASSSDEQEKAARANLHAVFPPWQAGLQRMQTSLLHREGTMRIQMQNTFALIGAVNVLFLALVLWLVRRFIITPIQSVEAAASRVALGDYSTSVPVAGKDEISSLAAEFNRMSMRLQETISALRSSEQQLAEKATALQRANKDLEQYAYAAAHDLQEPLRILSLYVQMLNKRCQLLPDAARFTVQIQESAERMRQLVADLLVHSRSIHESALSVPTEPNRALAKAITSLTDTISITGAVIRHEPLPSVFAAEPDLELVFRNLIANALKYRADKAPEVDITATVTNGQCTIAVRDNGIGISPEYHQQVFGLFKRLHGREVPGTGVGLAVTRNVIEKHGGRIWVESEAGSGATFKFQLQLTSAAAVA